MALWLLTNHWSRLGETGLPGCSLRKDSNLAKQLGAKQLNSTFCGEFKSWICKLYHILVLLQKADES